jgi:hypothetical protein
MLCPSGSFKNGLGEDVRETGHNRDPPPPDNKTQTNLRIFLLFYHFRVAQRVADSIVDYSS